MVAPAQRLPSQTHTHEEPRPRTYALEIDPTLAGVEGAPHHPTLVPLHRAFAKVRRLTGAEQREFMVKQTALRIAAGLELRSLRSLAKEIGCSHTTLDKALLKLCERVGMRKYCRSDETREKLSRARVEFLNSHGPHG